MITSIIAHIFPNLFLACDLSQQKFFFLPPWWEYLNGTTDPLGKCVPDFHFPDSFLAVGLAILDILIRFAGLAAVIGVIWGGVAYMSAGGNPENAAKARGRIYNSLIGLAIVSIAAAIVAFIGNTLT